MSSVQNKFPSIDRDQWRAMVTATMKNKNSKSLDRVDEDGLEIKALYEIQGHENADAGKNTVTACAITRLPVNPEAHLAHGWDICQPVSADGPAEETNRLILDELSDGVGTIRLEQMPGANLAANLPMMMRDVLLPAVGIDLDSGNDVIAHLAGFSNFAKTQNKTLSDLRFSANIDPFAPDAALSLLDDGLEYLAETNAGDIPFGLFRTNGWVWHNRGMTAVQELACVLASLVEIMRGGMARGLDLSDLASRLSASLALPADLFDGIAKCRALRRGWGGIVSALGLDPDAHRLFLQGAVSVRMFSLADDEVNILRTTTALLGGAIGGADQLSAHAHDCLGGSSAAGRRLARMQQHLLIEESGLARSLDAAGGAGFIEARSDQLADAAWRHFQKIEADGGAKVAHLSGQFDLLAKKAAGQRHARLAAGDLALVGVNLQPNGRSITSSLPRWQMLRRPAAAIEDLCRSTAQNPPRILLLQQGNKPSPQLVKLRALLAIGGIQPVQLHPDDMNEQAVTSAQPDLVILAGDNFEALAPSVKVGLKDLHHEGKVITVAAILGASVPLEILGNMAGISLETYRKGEA
jgi:methylmalonyl-CoA mutase